MKRIDIKVYKATFIFWLKSLKILFLGKASKKVILFYRASTYFNKKKMNFFSYILMRKIERDFGVYIHKDAIIKNGLSLPHPVGIVIGQGVVIDANVTIYQNVTLGGARRGDWKENNYPKIGSGTTIFSGAVIIGDLKIGRNCVIGANAVVKENVPDGALAVGVPARIIEN